MSKSSSNVLPSEFLERRPLVFQNKGIRFVFLHPNDLKKIHWKNLKTMKAKKEKTQKNIY